MGPRDLWAYFQGDLIKGHKDVKLPYKCPMATKFGRKNPTSECNTLLGQRSCRGQLRSARGQIA